MVFLKAIKCFVTTVTAPKPITTVYARTKKNPRMVFGLVESKE